jgi:hypothetical protein
LDLKRNAGRFKLTLLEHPLNALRHSSSPICPPNQLLLQATSMTSAEGTVSGEELARWLGLSGKEVYDLAKAGILVRAGRSYRLEESVRRYCDYLRRVPATAIAKLA